MKVNYFGYCIKNNETGKKVLFDIRPFLKAYYKNANTSFKNSFRHHDEHIYLIHHIGDTFFFLATRSNELIKKVNTNNISVGEITSLLEQDEHIGFTSYLHIKEDHFGFASTYLAPKADIFIHYVNELLVALGITNWTFLPQALLYQATREEALSLQHIGRTTIELTRDNSFTQDLLALVSADTNDTTELEGIEIIIKPKSRKNIKPTVNKFLSSIPDSGIEKMIMKAKDETASNMRDLYLVGRGAICDKVDKSNEIKIPTLLETKMTGNEFLKTKLVEYRENGEFEENIPEIISSYTNPDTWATFLCNISENGEMVS
ncbi:hypothetical protein [Microbulbifer sp. PSTR4-B]|uniref:hypothetical protein n=1 Tax=Microbulbifer sp. PSTR4-B TaxID=3243396 RepID=UPI0040396E3F